MKHHHIPETGYVREPAILYHLPFSHTTLWQKIKDGDFPQPVKLSTRITAWRAEDVRDYINKFSSR